MKFLEKISLSLDNIKKIQGIFPSELLLAIYNAVVLPHINYCSIILGC